MASIDGHDEVFLTPEELSARYNKKISVRTLANWRWQGKGPEYQKTGGKVLYPLSSIIEYEKKNRVNGTDQYRR